MSENLALFSKEKEYFLTSNTMSSFQISTQKCLRERKERREEGKEGGICGGVGGEEGEERERD